MREDLSNSLLAWYDRHARVMPWRVGPEARRAGQRPDPYEVWLSEVMLQQTTVAAVRAYWRSFMERWPRVEDLAQADDAEVMAAWAGLGYYARARNLLKCARVVAGDHGGRFPSDRAALLGLPGIGPYTAASLAAIAFDRPETVVDGNVERVISRLHALETPLPKAKPEIAALAAEITPLVRAGDYAQAIMDLGATVCTPRNPACAICPWSETCAARRAQNPLDYPKKTPKQPKPTRLGHVYLAHTSKGWLIERRPDSGLLGGMLGFPGSDWSADPAAAPPYAATWKPIGEVRHTFTHFHLILTVHLSQEPGPGRFEDLDPDSLPTVFRKAFDLTQGHLAQS